MCIEKVIAGALIIIGLFYVTMPHSIHISSGLGFEWTHTMHIMFGLVLFITAGILWFSKQKKTRPSARKRRRRK